MSLYGRLTSAFAIAFTGIALGVAARAPALAIALGSLSISTLLLPRSFGVGRVAEIVLSLFSVTISWIVAVSIIPEDASWYSGRLTLIFFGFGLSTCLLALTRLVARKPWGGYETTALLSLLSWLSASTAQGGLPFIAFGIAYIILQLAAMNAIEPSRPDPRRMTVTQRRAIVIAAVSAVALTTLFAAILPPTYDWTVRYFGLRIFGARSGFSTRLSLGSLSGMAQSDEVVLRIYGEYPDHLRGMVYSNYRNGHWQSSRRNVAGDIATNFQESRGSDETEIWSVGGRRRRYFTPLHAEDVQISGGRGQIDAVGIYYPPDEERADVIRFLNEPRQRHDPMPPSQGDVQVPAKLLGHLQRIAREWTGESENDEAQLAALAQRFQRDFDYSLEYRSRRGVDPVLDFLHRKTGHCEYFASAMALLARSLDIPARVVAGYRVTEFNSVGGYYLVRERNAHAWVEAWLPERGWVTYDPTPPAGLESSMYTETPWGSGTWDHLGSLIRRGSARLLNLDPRALAAFALLILISWLSVRAVLRWQAQKKKSTPPSLIGYSSPRPIFLAFLQALDGFGVGISNTDTVERIISKLEEDDALPSSMRAEAIALLIRYSNWRFGGVGDPEELDRELEAWMVENRQPGDGK